MLEKILSSIEEKANEEIAQIVREKDKALLAMKEEFKQRGIDEKKIVEKNAQEKSISLIEEFSQQKKMENDFAFQRAKNEAIDFAYKKASEEISKLSGKDFEVIIVNLRKDLPLELKGKIKAGEKTKKILQSLSGFSGVEISGDLDEEGFVFRTNDLEIDARLSQIVEQSKDKTITQAINILFD